MTMHSVRLIFLLLLLTIGLPVLDIPALAGGTVQLELIGDMRGSAMLFQQWARLLGQAGIENIRMRAAEDSDNVGIEIQGTADNPTYIVTGVIQSHDELLLPGGRFRRVDIGRLKQWLKELAERGPAGGKEEKAAFGLTSTEFDRVREDLAAPVGFSTESLTCQKIVQRIAERLKMPLQLDLETGKALADKKCNEELSGLSNGTALAYVLRLAGYGLRPRVVGNGLTYSVVKVQGSPETWPVGWPMEKPLPEVLPALFEFHNVNVQNVPVQRALVAIAKRLKTPVLVDCDAIARHGIDPAKVMVSLPSTRTTYSLALRKLLFQAGMRFEVRCDEAGAPLLWITSLKP